MDPLGDVDKFLDCQLRPKAVLSAIGGGGGKDVSAPDPVSKALVKQYLIKWKSLIYTALGTSLISNTFFFDWSC